jgi:hypothetical protein
MGNPFQKRIGQLATSYKCIGEYGESTMTGALFTCAMFLGWNDIRVTVFVAD